MAIRIVTTYSHKWEVTVREKKKPILLEPQLICGLWSSKANYPQVSFAPLAPVPVHSVIPAEQTPQILMHQKASNINQDPHSLSNMGCYYRQTNLWQTQQLPHWLAPLKDLPSNPSCFHHYSSATVIYWPARGTTHAQQLFFFPFNCKDESLLLRAEQCHVKQCGEIASMRHCHVNKLHKGQKGLLHWHITSIYNS